MILRWEAPGILNVLAVDAPKISTIVTLVKWLGAAEPGGMKSNDLAVACQYKEILAGWTEEG